MNRRRFCALSATAVAGLAGCLDSDSNSRSGDSPDDGDDNTDTFERPWDRRETSRATDGVHDLFVENHTDTTEPAWLRVRHADGSVLVDGKYELPSERAIEFDSLVGWDQTWTVDIAVRGLTQQSFEWSTPTCRSDSESGAGGSRNGAVRLETGVDGRQFDFRSDQCDAVQTGTLPAGPAESFRLDE